MNTIESEIRVKIGPEIKPKIRAKIGYEFFSSMPADMEKTDNEIMTFADGIKELGTVQSDAIIGDIDTAQSFLYGNGTPFYVRRFVFDIPGFSIGGRNFSDAHMLLGVSEETNVVSAGINFTYETDSEEDLVYLRQIQDSDITFDFNGSDLSLNAFAAKVFSFFQCVPGEYETAYLLELNRYGDDTEVDSIIKSHPQELYGMITGDEGFMYAGKEHAADRLSNCWSTRKFVKVIAFQNNFMLINLNHSPAGMEYMRHQEKYGNKYYGSPNPYFFMDARTSCVCHGLFFTVETGMIAKCLASHILARQAEKFHTKHFASASEIYKTKMIRRDLLLTLKRLEKVEISEIGALENLVMDGLDILPLIEKIRHLMDLLESELDMLYQTNTNTLVNILTVMGLILATLEIVLPFIVE